MNKNKILFTLHYKIKNKKLKSKIKLKIKLHIWFALYD
jgi:hypothetical protein